MKIFMIDIELPEVKDEQFMQLVPQQRELVNRWLTQGIILSYTLNLSKSKLWVVGEARAKENMLGLLQQFPIYAYIKFEMHEVQFHDVAPSQMPQLWLN